MKVDAIRLDLRPRSMFEAADLGVRLVSAHLRSVWTSCAPVYAFVLLVAATMLPFGIGWTLLTVIWLKPWLDRSILFVLALNGALAGSVAGYLTWRGHGENFYSFVITHGAFELTGIVLAGAAGLALGHALLVPGRRSRLAALQLAARRAIVIVYGMTAMFVVAAALEAFWSSARWVPVHVKLVVGAACWVGVLCYFLFQGRPGRLRP